MKRAIGSDFAQRLQGYVQMQQDVQANDNLPFGSIRLQKMLATTQEILEAPSDGTSSSGALESEPESLSVRDDNDGEEPSVIKSSMAAASSLSSLTVVTIEEKPLTAREIFKAKNATKRFYRTANDFSKQPSFMPNAQAEYFQKLSREMVLVILEFVKIQEQ